MELKDKISILADAAKYDASCASSGNKRQAQKGGIGNLEGSGICHSYTPDGRCISLLKILLTNFCIYDCSYCVNRISSQVKRAKFSIQEVVDLTMNFYKRNYIEGLFLSSGIAKSSDETMEEMIEIARRLRVDHKFGGYIHLKAVAGCSQLLLEKAGLYADRTVGWYGDRFWFHRPHHCWFDLGNFPYSDHHAASLYLHDADPGLCRPGSRKSLIYL